MKRIVLICGLLLSIFLLVACGGSVELAAVEPQVESAVEMASEAEVMVEEPKAVVAGEELEVEVVEAEVDVEDPAVVEEAQIAIAAAEIVNPNEFDKISQTGRPQFLNSYADW